MTFTPKAWANYPVTTTPINAAALVDLETRVTNYADPGDKNVDDYFVGGDADDTNSFGRAYDAAIADGRGVVRFRSGKTYTISSIAKTGDNITIWAYGAYIKSTLGKTTAATVVDLHGNNLKVLGGMWDHTTAESVDADAGARVSAFYFRFGAANPGWTFYTDLLVKDTVILNGRNTPIGVYATSRARIKDNTIVTSLGNGIFCANNPFDLEITGNYIWDTGDDSIAVVADAALTALSQRVTITHNHCYRSAGHAIDTTGVDGCLIDYNHIELTWVNAIFVWFDVADSLGNSKNVRIGDSNTIRDAGQYFGTSAAQTTRGVANPATISTFRPTVNASPFAVKLAGDVDEITVGYPRIRNSSTNNDYSLGITGSGSMRRTSLRPQPITASNYIGTPGCNVASAVATDGRVTYCKVSIAPNQGNAKNIAVRTTGTVGSAGSVIRLGIYHDNGFSAPTRLLSDLGTVDTTTAGNKVLSIAGGTGISISAGEYWLAAASQGGAATQPTVFQLTGQADGMPAGSDASQPTNGYFGSSVAGALPSTATINGFATNATAVRLGF